MSWNLEIVVLERTENEDRLDCYVPDVFFNTSRSCTFEDATSVSFGQALAVAEIGDRIVIVDTQCRASAMDNFILASNIKATTGWLYRIADDPVEQIFVDAELREENIGSDAIRLACDLTATITDGEDIAVAALRRRTGLSFPDDLLEVQFAAYDLN